MRLVALISLVVGIWLGAASQDPPTEYKVIHKTDTVTETVTVTERTAFVPNSCLQAAVRAKRIANQAANVDRQGDAVMRLVSEFTIAAGLNDTNEMILVKNRAHKMLGRTLGYQLATADLKQEYDMYAQRCIKDIEEQNHG